MVRRVQEAWVAIGLALRSGLKHLCLTDPEARMMPEGRTKRVQMCHSWEIAVDREAALLAMGQSTQTGNDNARLEAIVEAAAANEPEGVLAVDADSGYYAGDAIGRLITAGVDTCVPDSTTACDLHRGQPVGTTRSAHQGKVPFVYDERLDLYRCPEGNELRLKQEGHQNKGQTYRDYRATRPCTGCPLAPECLVRPNARYRTLKVAQYAGPLEAARERFNEPAHQERYRHRGDVVETVFGFLRSTLGYTRWLLRGKERVACEERLFRLAYQVRKVHGHWAEANR
jgi:hypothetical protein